VQWEAKQEAVALVSEGSEQHDEVGSSVLVGRETEQKKE
jgi:hypothetical protein